MYPRHEGIHGFWVEDVSNSSPSWVQVFPGPPFLLHRFPIDMEAYERRRGGDGVV